MKNRNKQSESKPKATPSISSPNQNIDKNGVPMFSGSKAEHFEFSPKVINILAHLIVEMETENENDNDNRANNNSSIHPTDS